MRPVALHEVLEGVLALAAPQLQHSRIEIEREWADQLPWVRAIANHLRQVFLNLVLNAVEAMPQGGRLTIRTRFEEGHTGQAPRLVVVEFADTGPGIPDEELQTIFEPFYTTKTQRTGLGLSISYSIIEQHEGTLSVTTTSEGATFRVALPAL
jgi:signal transduction histidine kinase